MEIKVWSRRWIILLSGIFLFGCATSEDAKVLDERIYQLRSQLSTIEKEKDSLNKELTAFRKETQANISTLKKEDDLLRTALPAESKKVQDVLSLRLENLQSQLSTIQKEKDSLSRELAASRMEAMADISTLKKEDDLLRAALPAESKKVQDALSLRLENLQSQLSTIQKEKDSLSRELTAFRMEAQADISTLKKEDDLLRTALPAESKKVQDALSLRLENLQYEIRIHSTAVEEYRDLLQRTSKEIDRLKDQIATRTKVLEESEKILEGKNSLQEDRVNVLEERIRGTEDRLKGLDEKIAQIVLKEEEMGKMISEAKETATASRDLYRDAYETLQKGDLEGAQRKFEVFLKQYPNTELSDNAQFWIGEIYYLKKDFEKAILEYEKAIVKYPEGDKIPASLFKQALAFLELGDKKNAKNLLKRVIERYPHSDQVDIAKKKLQGIK
jgi:tol-pal system protein YbgF